MKLFLLFLPCIFLCILARASHIVGGDMELVYQGRQYFYEIRLNMYYDDINADPALMDADLQIQVNIFRKSDNSFEKSVTLNRTTSDLITYSYNGCSDPSKLRTRLFRYTGIVDLIGFTSAQGYYVTWERCCRNYVSKNIFHTDVFGRRNAGQVFYLEFPPVIKDGNRFYNSTPLFSIIPADYLCKGSLYDLSFAAQDLNGDSLVYSVVSPLKGHTRQGMEYSDLPAPYDSVAWRPGYSRTNMIPGTPPLGINRHTGKLSVMPTDTGLFVFGVRVEEFRNGVKIGEARRDFQYLVYNCPPNIGNSIGLDPSNNPQAVGDTIYALINELTCANIFATDSNTTQLNENETILISSVSTPPISNTYYFSATTFTLSPGTDTSNFQLCINPCDKFEPQQDTLVSFNIVVKDDRCPAKSDTSVFWVKYMLPASNVPPVIDADLPSDTVEVFIDSLLQFVVYATDADNSDLYPISASGDGFDLSFYGMEFNNTYMDSDSAAGIFQWRPTCEQLESNPKLLLRFNTKDKSCRVSHQKETTVLIVLKENPTDLPDLLPPNLVTINGDGKNDCFEIPNMPPDNCEHRFKKIEIYNRWGSCVYQASTRGFTWCPDTQPDGVYYYYLDLDSKRIKGWIQIIR